MSASSIVAECRAASMGARPRSEGCAAGETEEGDEDGDEEGEVAAGRTSSRWGVDMKIKSLGGIENLKIKSDSLCQIFQIFRTFSIFSAFFWKIQELPPII